MVDTKTNNIAPIKKIEPKKQDHGRNFFIALALSTIFMALIPITQAYSVGLDMINLWDLFVVYLSGSFWIAVLVLTMIFWIILTIGNLSGFSILSFELLFLMAMGMGYNRLIAFVCTLIAATWMVFNIKKLFEV